MIHDPGGKSKPKWPSDSCVYAVFDGPNDCYRYALEEIWDPSKPLVMWLMMNPSVASTEHSDPTLRKTGSFSRSWGYGGQLIGNVCAYRATDSHDLVNVADPVGPANAEWLSGMARRADLVVLAYGQPKVKHLRHLGKKAVSGLRSPFIKLAYLRLAKDGTPCHPLYLPLSLTPTMMEDSL